MADLKRLQQRPKGGPLKSLQGQGDAAGKYGFSSLNYPLKIDEISHCMLFNINVHENSKDIGGTQGMFFRWTENNYNRIREASPLPLPGLPGGMTAEQVIGNQREKLSSQETPRYTQTKTEKIGLTRRTRRVLRAISLYVPDTVVFDSQQKYETPSLLDTLGIAGTAAASLASASPAMAAGIGAIGLGAAAVGAGAIAARFGTAGLLVAGAAARSGVNALTKADTAAVNAAKTGAKIFGYAVNPVIEVLYQHPQLRNFRFDFVFSPRSRDEADKVWEIIQEFRRHSAPEFLNNSGGLILVPPSDFDITFMRKTSSGFVENTNIPRISSCVLEDVAVDYASAGSYSTFSDGMPIQIRMTLAFKELNIITREDIDEGY